MNSAPKRGGGPIDGPRPNWFGGITIALNVIGTVWIIFLMVLINADVFARWLLNSSVPGVKEIVGQSIVAIVFLQLANTLRENRHVSSDVLFKVVELNWPRVAVGCYAVFNLTGALLIGTIVVFALPILEEAWREEFTEGTPGVFLMPVWPFLLIVLIGALATAIQYLILFVRDLRVLIKGRHAQERAHEVPPT